LVSTLTTTSASTPTPLIPRNKRRAPLDLHDEVDSQFRRTRPRESYTPIEKVAAAITQLADTRRGFLQLAIIKLQKNFKGRLTEEHMYLAMEFLESESKAAIFGGLEDGEFQDRWLKRNTGVQIIRDWTDVDVD
jgi:hypothetical protein